MQEKGFDPVLNSINFFVTKAEQLEEAEASEDAVVRKKTMHLVFLDQMTMASCPILVCPA